MSVPDPLIMAARKHLFPEHEFELDNNAIRGAKAVTGVNQVLALLVTVSFGDRKTVFKVFVPRPMVPINQLERIRYSIAYSYLANVEWGQ
ncbi:hypothetical protein PSCICF_10270 [Pseudomonas cichorii]|nr:hypothetical protein PSCICF_10270 [Pseudomonas cichorii]GFM60719.1 hypothetical protein PSCICG_18790 [Pseudomonas cichorii]